MQSPSGYRGNNRVESESVVEDVEDAVLFNRTSPFPGRYTPSPAFGKGGRLPSPGTFGSFSPRPTPSTPGSYAQKFVDAGEAFFSSSS